MMSQNITRLEKRIDGVADDLKGIDRRVMRIELMVDLAKEHQPRRRHPKELS